MNDRLMSVEVPARDGRRFQFSFYGDPGFIPEWQAAGVNVSEIVNRIPEWVVDLSRPWFPTARIWCFFQDLFQFKNPWAVGPPPTVCPGCRWKTPDGRCARHGLPLAWFSACHEREEASRG